MGVVKKFLALRKRTGDIRPRHHHSGRKPGDSIMPLENASMPGRVVAQWDKEDCADLGIIKADLTGCTCSGNESSLAARKKGSQ